MILRIRNIDRGDAESAGNVVGRLTVLERLRRSDIVVPPERLLIVKYLGESLHQIVNMHDVSGERLACVIDQHGNSLLCVPNQFQHFRWHFPKTVSGFRRVHVLQNRKVIQQIVAFKNPGRTENGRANAVLDFILPGHGFFHDFGESIVPGIGSHRGFFTDWLGMRVEPNSLSSISTQQDELSYAVRKAAGFENVKRAADADVEKCVRVFLRRCQLDDDV